MFRLNRYTKLYVIDFIITSYNFEKLDFSFKRCIIFNSIPIIPPYSQGSRNKIKVENYYCMAGKIPGKLYE